MSSTTFIVLMANIFQKLVEKSLDHQRSKNMDGTSTPTIVTKFSHDCSPLGRRKSSKSPSESEKRDSYKHARHCLGPLVAHMEENRSLGISFYRPLDAIRQISVSGVAATADCQAAIVWTEEPVFMNHQPSLSWLKAISILLYATAHIAWLLSSNLTMIIWVSMSSKWRRDSRSSSSCKRMTDPIP